MNTNDRSDDEQAALWNGHAGRAWVEAQVPLDTMLKPFEDLLVDSVAAGFDGQVLDVGCGTGSTTLALTRRLGANGGCAGIDISKPMIAAARARAEEEGSAARFLCADAQTHSFAPGRFDKIVSRFGVMFFNAPVQAFANLRCAAREGAELRFVAWRSAAENPFMTTAERAAGPLLPNLPVRQPGAPGQFAFADRSRVQGILAESGWTHVDIQPLDVVCVLPENKLVGYLSRLGPVGLMLDKADEQTRKQVIETVRAAFEVHVHGAEVRFTAACWRVSALASAA